MILAAIQNDNDSQDKTKANAKEESTQDWKVNAVWVAKTVSTSVACVCNKKNTLQTFFDQ